MEKNDARFKEGRGRRRIRLFLNREEIPLQSRI